MNTSTNAAPGPKRKFNIRRFLGVWEYLAIGVAIGIGVMTLLGTANWDFKFSASSAPVAQTPAPQAKPSIAQAPPTQPVAPQVLPSPAPAPLPQAPAIVPGQTPGTFAAPGTSVPNNPPQTGTAQAGAAAAPVVQGATAQHTSLIGQNLKYQGEAFSAPAGQSIEGLNGLSID